MSNFAKISFVTAAGILGGFSALGGSDSKLALYIRHFTFDMHVWIDHVFSIIIFVILWFTIAALWQWFWHAIVQRRRVRLDEIQNPRRLFLPYFWASFVLVKLIT